MQTVATAAENFADNRCRYDGRRTGYYEVWFLTLNDPVTNCGFWFRYALDIAVGTTDVHPSIWGSFFNPNTGTRFGITNRFPSNSWQTSNQNQRLITGVGEYGLYQDRLVGEVAQDGHKISWQLEFTPATETFHHIDKNVKRFFHPKTEICAPNLAVNFTGVVEVDGEKFYLERAPGGQQHIWGTKHAEGWSWVHCNIFTEIDNTAITGARLHANEIVFEALAASPKLAGMTLPPLTLANLRYQGRSYCFNKISNFLHARNDSDEFSWKFIAGDANTRITGSASARPEQMVQVIYPDPDGELLYCINSEIGELTLKLEERASRFSPWQAVTTLTSRGFAHFERASRKQQPKVPLILS